MENKRKIKSVAELVNALEKGVKVECFIFDEWVLFTNENLAFSSFKDGIKFNYSEPVEVVELWGHDIGYSNWKSQYDTDKQTQIIQNGEVIWTETEKIK